MPRGVKKVGLMGLAVALCTGICLSYVPFSWAGNQGRPAQGPSAWLQGQLQESPRQLAQPRGRGHGRGFDELPPEDRQHMDRQYRQWQALPPEEKEKMRRRMEQWRRMPPGQQERYQQRYRQWKRLSPEEQKQLENQLYRWESLSPEEKEKIRRRFRE